MRSSPAKAAKALAGIKSPRALLAVALLSAAMAGCGGSGKGTSSAPAGAHSAGLGAGAAKTIPSPAAPPGGHLKEDGDQDGDDRPRSRGAESDDRSFLATYGHTASPSDAGAIRRLVKSYYAAATAGDAAQTCSLLASSLVAGLAGIQQQPTRPARGTCAASVAPLLRQQHQRLIAEEVATMVVISVHVKGNLGLAVLGFRTMPEAAIIVEREGHTWKIDALADNPLR